MFKIWRSATWHEKARGHTFVKIYKSIIIITAPNTTSHLYPSRAAVS